MVRQISKWLGLLMAILSGIILIAGLALYLMDWNWLRKPVSSLVSEALDRPFVIKGQVTINWSWNPTLTLNDMTLGNPAWAKQPDMITLNRIQATLSLADLLKGHIVLPKLQVEKPSIYLQRNQNGEVNWHFGESVTTNDETLNPRWIPKIQHLALSDGSVKYIDDKANAELNMILSTVLGKSDEQLIQLNGQGKLRKEQFNLELNGGSVLALWKPEQPFPLKIKINYGKTKVSVSGTLVEPMAVKGIDLQAEISGPDLSQLSPFTGALLPATQAYRFAADIKRSNKVWIIKNFNGRLGNSELNGAFSFRTRNQRPFVEGEVFSKKLDFQDFAGFIGANPNPGAPGRAKLFPGRKYNVEGFRLLDAAIEFTSDNIITPYMPIDLVRADIKLTQGLLEIKPFQATIEQGKIVSNIMLDAKQSTIKTKLETRIDKVPFKRLLKKTPFAKQTAGVFMGKMDIATVGNSIAEMAANSDGGITVLMQNGHISGLLMELAGLDILESLGILLNRDPALPVPCTIVDFIDTGGVLKTKLFLMDTTDNKLTVEGQINLKNEKVNLRITSKPKDISLFSAKTPIIVDGTLKKPGLRPDPLSLGAKIAASVGLAIAGGPAAILPWLDLGLEENSPCQALLKAASKQDNIPLPGKKPAKKRK